MQETTTIVKFVSTDREKVNEFLRNIVDEKNFYVCSPILPCIKTFKGKQTHAFKVDVKFKTFKDD